MKQFDAPILIFRVGALCMRAECNCAVYEGREIDQKNIIMPPLHEDCDCYAYGQKIISEELARDPREDP